MASAISCQNLTKRYGDVLALDRLTLDVPSGALFGFLGPNGAGKTTALRLLTGLAFPDGGSATVAGIDVATGGVNLRSAVPTALAGAAARLDDFLKPLDPAFAIHWHWTLRVRK